MTKESGVLGEDVAAYYLADKGYVIRTRNYSCRFGEIDIIAEQGNYLCFVEVKTRGDRAFGQPAEWVTTEKQRKLIKTANYYIAVHGKEIRERNLQPRFDCIEVFLDHQRLPCNLTNIKNAF